MNGFKTLAVAVALMLMGLLEQINVVDIIPPNYQGLATLIIGVVMAGLRFVTTGPVGVPTNKDT